MTQSQKKLQVLDLFAGAGGLSLGFEMAGFEIVGAIESDKWCCDTFAANHPKATVICDDIRKLPEEAIKKSFNAIDVLVGGPPCQGFSISNSRGRDPKDPRNSLFREFIRVISYLKPKIVVMENVKGLTSFKTARGEKVIEIIETELKELGYSVQTHILHAADYGVPQMRERVFVMGILNGTLEDYALKPSPTHGSIKQQLKIDALQLLPYVTVWDAISDLPQTIIPDDNKIWSYTLEPQNMYQKEMRRGSNAIYNHSPMKHSKRIVERLKILSLDSDRTKIPEEFMPRIRNGNGAIAKAIYDQNHRRLKPDDISYTIAASFYANFIHPFLPRNITAREGARLQSFPDRYVFKGKKTVVSSKLLSKEGRYEENYLSQYQQIGNAVPPLLAKAIALNLMNNL